MSDLSRRAVLLGAVGGTALFAAGCSADALPIIGGKEPDEDLRLLTAASEQDLIAAYDSALAANPGLGRELSAIKAQHEQHLAAVLDGLEPPASRSRPPVAAEGAVRTLRRMEAGAARQRAQACAAAEDPKWVLLLAVIGASEAGHAAAVGRQQVTG